MTFLVLYLCKKVFAYKGSCCGWSHRAVQMHHMPKMFKVTEIFSPFKWFYIISHQHPNLAVLFTLLFRYVFNHRILKNVYLKWKFDYMNKTWIINSVCVCSCRWGCSNVEYYICLYSSIGCYLFVVKTQLQKIKLLVHLLFCWSWKKEKSLYFQHLKICIFLLHSHLSSDLG